MKVLNEIGLFWLFHELGRQSKLGAYCLNQVIISLNEQGLLFKELLVYYFIFSNLTIRKYYYTSEILKHRCSGVSSEEGQGGSRSTLLSSYSARVSCKDQSWTCSRIPEWRLSIFQDLVGARRFLDSLWRPFQEVVLPARSVAPYYGVHKHSRTAVVSMDNLVNSLDISFNIFR